MSVMVVVPELANAYGLHEALVLRQLHYWLERATCQHEGKPWVYKSISEWSQEFTWWSRSTVHKLLTKLADDSLVTIRTANGQTYYTINYNNLRKECRDVLVMLSENRTEVSENRTEVSENRTEVSENRTAHNNEYTEITTETPIEGGEGHAPHLMQSGVAGAKAVRVDSPYLDARRFVNGFVPPGAGQNAVEVYYERFKIHSDQWRLTKPQEDDLVRCCADLDLLREVIMAYDQANYARPRNITLILDWYKDPSRFRSKHNGNHSGSNSTDYQRPETSKHTMAEHHAHDARQRAAGRPF